VCRHLTENLKSEIIQNSLESKPEQVIFAWNYLEWGGAQIYFLGIASRIKNRTNVKFVFPKETSRQFINFCENLQIPYEFIDDFTDLQPALTIKRKIQRHFNKARSEYNLIKFLKKYDFNNSILHIEFAPWQSLFALLQLCRHKKVFMTMHNSLPQTAKWRFLLWKLKFAIITQFENFHIFASNEDAKNSLKPLVSDEFLEKVKVTYTNVNPDEVDEALKSDFNREELLQKFGLPQGKFLVFCLGQFIDRKGRWAFLEAAQKLKKFDEEIVFVWISNSKLTAEESSKIESFGLGDSFFLIKSEAVGSEHLDLMKFLRLADVFTLPSFVEGLPISLLEAMAMGIPSISTDVYAIPEAVKNLETGILIEAGNSDALAKAIGLLKEDNDLRRKLSQNGRAFVMENFNEKTVAEIVFENYKAAFKQN
jgi:glycosyltransferase involved in cell wall biosynthesis